MLDTDIDALYLESNNGRQRPQRNGVGTMHNDTTTVQAFGFAMHNEELRIVAIKPAPRGDDGFYTLCHNEARAEYCVHYAEWFTERDGSRTLATYGGFYYDDLTEALAAFHRRG